MSDDTLNAASRLSVIDALLQKLHEHYIFPEVVSQIQASLRARLETGIYDQCSTPSLFCEMLSQHLEEISHDKHLRVRFTRQSQRIDQPPPPQPKPDDSFAVFLRLRNFGFQKIERLAGQ